MAQASRSKPIEPEYVTDWRVVYAVLGVITTIVVGGFGWVLYAPTRAVPVDQANSADADTVPAPSHRNLDDQAADLEFAVPWAPLPAERSWEPEAIPQLPSATIEVTESTVSVRSDIASGGNPIDEDIEGDITTRQDELIVELQRTTVLDFNSLKASSNAARPVQSNVRGELPKPPPQEQHFAILANQTDLKGMPIRDDNACQKSSSEVTELARVSKHIASNDGPQRFASRRTSSQSESSFSASPEGRLDRTVYTLIEESALNETSVGPLVQILQVQNASIRMQLINALTSIDGSQASRGLADRAMFDLSPVIRAAAIESLKRRDAGEYRWRLLEGLRYPWAPVAIHAAKALIAVGDIEALPQLKALLDEPDPSVPYKTEDGTWKQNELVRVNHLRNCLLCHPQSNSHRDQVRGSVPTPGRPLPRSYGGRLSGKAVRADITYLVQDFSVMQPVADQGVWPDMQRFDFLVRIRKLPEDEVDNQTKVESSDAITRESYPQRKAVLWAIKRLTETSANRVANLIDTSG